MNPNFTWPKDLTSFSITWSVLMFQKKREFLVWNQGHQGNFGSRVGVCSWRQGGKCLFMLCTSGSPASHVTDYDVGEQKVEEKAKAQCNRINACTLFTLQRDKCGGEWRMRSWVWQWCSPLVPPPLALSSILSQVPVFSASSTVLRGGVCSWALRDALTEADWAIREDAVM